MIDFKIRGKSPEFNFACSKSWRKKNYSPAETQLVEIKKSLYF